MNTFQKDDIVTNDRYKSMGKSFTYVEQHKTARGGVSHEVRNSGGYPDFFDDDAGLYVVNPAPAPFKKGDRVYGLGSPALTFGTVTEVSRRTVRVHWDGTISTEGLWCDPSDLVRAAQTAPVDNSESIGIRNNRSTEPAPFKVGDVVDGIYDVPGHGAIIAEVFDTGHVITTWPNGSRHVEEKRFLKHAKPTVQTPSIDTGSSWQSARKSDWELNPPAPEDVVSSPSHYRAHPSGIEVIDITRHESFLRGNILKYALRAPYKNNELEDMKKAAQYLAWEIERLEGEQP